MLLIVKHHLELKELNNSVLLGRSLIMTKILLRNPSTAELIKLFFKKNAFNFNSVFANLHVNILSISHDILQQQEISKNVVKRFAFFNSSFQY